MTEIRPPAVAGSFYPGTREALSRDVAALLATAPAAPDSPVPKALIAPHAGYIYSGPVAASAYGRLARARGRIKRVVLLGPAHRVAVRGLALPAALGFQTPLGVVPVDRDAVRALSSMTQISESRDAHAQEHSLEVHLPFLQSVLGTFAVVPLVVGDASADEVAEVLDRLWGGAETLIVVSSDLSHYLSYDRARAVDRETARAIVSREPRISHFQACGATPVNGLLAAALRRGLRAELLDLRNSGDTAGDRSRVVGYGSIGFFEPEAPAVDLNPDSAEADERGKVLIGLARAAIGGMFGLSLPVDEGPAFLRQTVATFVTLQRHGRLRGCIGSLEARRTLLDDVKLNAKAAAFLDPRFEPLTQTEFPATLVEVSLLSTAEPLTFASEADAIAQIRPHVDGLIIEHSGKRGTFLPQVWDHIPDAAEFLRELKRKAGLEAGFWAQDVMLQRYTVVKFREREFTLQ
ncbi:MAG TPA: AmmeMemoRadiSam system protein B [Burkholderiales bacterium]|nr:AmmeMemoRadiSam system protein B [Burkholderiales bacterium]